MQFRSSTPDLHNFYNSFLQKNRALNALFLLFPYSANREQEYFLHFLWGMKSRIFVSSHVEPYQGSQRRIGYLGGAESSLTSAPYIAKYTQARRPKWLRIFDLSLFIARSVFIWFYLPPPARVRTLFIYTRSLHCAYAYTPPTRR